MLSFVLIGFAAGALTGVPIGPVNVAVIDAAYRHTLRRALAVGFGGACADSAYAALGILGVTPVLRSYKLVSPILYAVSGLVLLVYGFLTARAQPVTPASSANADGKPEPSELWQGFRVGLLLIVLNPAAVVTWVVIVTNFVPSATTGNAIACAVGVFGGSFSWFALVATLTHRGKHVLGDKAAWIPRVIGIALMIYAVYMLVQAVKTAIA
ncbi:MAG TPA: LysE family transporter [Kofleriaceae bacterium]